MLRIPIPYFIATHECPSSCSSTQENKRMVRVSASAYLSEVDATSANPNTASFAKMTGNSTRTSKKEI